jgi:putative mRNA 3-end processing factor
VRARAAIELERGDLRVAGSGLFLDAKRRSECAFISHAHGDHLARHDRTIATAATLALAKQRLGDRAKKGEALPAAYREPFGLGDLEIELFPAGHVLGSAQIRVKKHGVHLGYSGDLCLDETLTAEAAEVMPCDVLVLESTFGKPRYVFPPKAEVLAAVKRFVEETFDAGATPVLLGYALGKAQEILKFLHREGFKAAVHPQVHAIDRVYESLGVDLGSPRVLADDGAPPAKDEVVVCPPHVARSGPMRGIRRRRTAALSGWALDGRHWFRGADAAFPLSDHADFPSLVRYAKATGAGRVFTVHGYADELAAALRAQGIRAAPLEETRQLELL